MWVSFYEIPNFCYIYPSDDCRYINWYTYCNTNWSLHPPPYRNPWENLRPIHVDHQVSMWTHKQPNLRKFCGVSWVFHDPIQSVPKMPLSGTLIPSEYVRIIGAFQHPTLKKLQNQRFGGWNFWFIKIPRKSTHKSCSPLHIAEKPIWARYSILSMLHKPEVNINEPFVVY